MPGFDPTAYLYTVATTPNVLEDARESHGAVPAPTRWAWLLVGLVSGAAAAVLILGMGAPSSSPASEPPAARAGPTVGGIADVIEGFPDGLVATTRSDGQSLEVLTWPLRGESYQRTIPVGVSHPPDAVAFDVAGRRIATVLPLPGEELGVLYSGIPENANIVATDVTGYAWHDSTASALAYTTYADNELLLWVVGPVLSEPELVTRAVGIEGGVRAWGDWGYAVQDKVNDRVVLFTENGELKDSHPGRVLDSHDSGWLAIEDTELRLLSAGGGVRGLDDPGGGRDVLAANLSSNGESLALLNKDRLVVVSLEDGSQLLESEGRAGVPQLTWSSDGRFVLYPDAVRGIWVVDTRSDEVEAILTTRIFTGLGIAPLSNS